ncbi:hypothetical protein PoB_003913200 [Plakobranchus ocellatus]|uniref:Retrotransposon gag domain-containing protein n=1 Tax=Plakobranchus ocellatus TaxID=259542 RepID=A0AAV4B013_9GAST|nr:hypothetical protein PoB_003913200 [Plakobranchus ocellatus]
MDICDERNAAFSWEETRPKKHVRSYTPADERREAPPASQYDEDSRRGQYSAEFQEDQHSRYFREHHRSGQLHNRNARRQYGYDSDESDDEPGHSKKFIQPPKSLIYSGESSWAAFEVKFKRFVREQMFSEKEAKDYFCWVLVDRAADYYTLMMREDRHMPLRQLMKRMEQRFVSKHPRETALIRFQNAKQRVEESIEDWAERLHHLALYAFEEDAGAGLWKRDIKQMMLKFCTGCADREAGLHAANMRPGSLDEATTFILQYQFNHAAVYGRKEDRSPEAAVRSVRSRRDYSEERSSPRREYRGRNATPVWNRAERPQNPRESRGERRDYSPFQDRPPFKSPQERREATSPGRSREAEQNQPELKNLLESIMAGLKSRLGRMMDEKLSNFASRIENVAATAILFPNAPSAASVRFEDPKKRNGVGIDAPTPTPEHRDAEPRSEDQRGEDKYEAENASWGSRGCPAGRPKDYPPQEVLDPNGQATGRASWGSKSCPTGHPKDSPAQEVLNPNGLDPPYQPQRVVNPNGLDPPRQLQKVVNPNGLDPLDQLKLKEELDLVASEGITGMQHQEIASGGEQSNICTGERNEIGVSDAGIARWNDRCCPDGYLKYGQPRNGLDPLHQSQKVINLNGLDPPYKPQKLVHPTNHRG